MRITARQRPPGAPPGLEGTARVERRTRILLPRLRPGDLAVVDHLDMDRATAQGLVDAGVVAVVNASPMISGRYPNLGPEVLAEAGIVLVDGIGAAGLGAIKDGASVRLHEATVYVDDRGVATGREVDAETIRAEMASARTGLVTQLETFTHNTTEFLRREQVERVLHGFRPRHQQRALAEIVQHQGRQGEHCQREYEQDHRFLTHLESLLVSGLPEAQCSSWAVARLM